MKENLIHQAYEIAKERYAELGIDTEKVLQQLQDFHLSMHCWQADDVKGFEVQAGDLSGGIQSTGNYPGAARTLDELRADVLKAKSLIPGTHRLNLHEIYGHFIAVNDLALKISVYLVEIESVRARYEALCLEDVCAEFVKCARCARIVTCGLDTS